MRAAILGVFMLIAVPGCAIDAPGLPVVSIVVDSAGGPRPFTVELASNPASQEKGLMYRREMSPNAGMLFDFHNPIQVSFWMKNTVLSLDIVFIRADGTISSIEPNAVPYSTALILSGEPVRAVLEINGGRAHELGIRAGDRVHGAIFHNTQ